MSGREPLRKSLRFEILRRDEYTCQYCGRSAPDVELHVDHVIPVCEGGRNHRENLVTSCAACNLGKGSGPSRTPSFKTYPETEKEEMCFYAYGDHAAWLTVLHACGEKVVV